MIFLKRNKSAFVWKIEVKPNQSKNRKSRRDLKDRNN
jgi:hypothetical protein